MTYYETCNNPKPTINELEHLLKNDPRVHQKKVYKQALELKLQAIKQEPSLIEKTMTEEQLYNANSPLWALNYDPDVIKQMLNHLRNYPKSEEIFNIVLEEVSNGIVAINKFGATL